MRLLTFFVMVCFIFANCYAQTLNLNQFSPLCSGSPDVDIKASPIADGYGYDEISGMTLCGNIEDIAITIQENGVIRQFNTSAYKDEAKYIGSIGSLVSSANLDFECITYLFEETGIHYYAAANEKQSKVAIFSIYLDANNELKVNIDINNGNPIFLTVINSLGFPIPGYTNNKGIEGISYNPNNGKMYFAKESPPEIYESQGSFFSKNDFTGISDISTTKISLSINENNDYDFSGLFHLNLGNNMGNQNLIMATSQESEKAYLIDLSAQIVSDIETFSFTGLHSDAKIEGVIFDRNILTVCNDNDEDDFFIYSDFYSYANQGLNGVLGDVSCDGLLLINDAYQTSQFSVGLMAQNCTFDMAAGDMNLNGVVNIDDAYAISRCAVKLREYYCPCKIEED